MKLFLVLALLLGGIAAVLYVFQIVRLFGHLAWAEQKLGPGGSYTAWRFIGLAMIIGACIVARYF